MLRNDPLNPHRIVANWWQLSHHPTTGLPIIAEHLIALGAGAAAVAQTLIAEPGLDSHGEPRRIHTIIEGELAFLVPLKREEPPEDSISRWVMGCLFNTSVYMPVGRWINDLGVTAVDLGARWNVHSGKARTFEDRRGTRTIAVDSVVAGVPSVRLTQQLVSTASDENDVPTAMLGAIASATGLAKILKTEIGFSQNLESALRLTADRLLHRRRELHLIKLWEVLDQVVQQQATAVRR